MPRKKPNNRVTVYGDSEPQATRRARTKSMVASATFEKGDPEQDGHIWLARIAMTRRQRQERKNGEHEWRRYYEWYEGEQWQDRGQWGKSLASDNARETATVNEVGSTVNSLVPFLIHGEIKFLLKPLQPDTVEQARIQEALLNYEWRERKMTRAVKACVKDMAIIGHCVAKTGYTVEVDEAVKPDESGRINYAEYVRKDAPYIERVNPEYFFWDLSAKDYSLYTARWCGEVFFAPLADVLANKDYDPEVLAHIMTGDYAPTTRAAFHGVGQTDPVWARTMRVQLPEDHLVPMIEIWDKKYQLRMIYADGVEKPLFYEDWPYDYLDGFPYVMAHYMTVPNNHYGIGLMKWCEDQQIQLNRIRTAQFTHVRESMPRYEASDDMSPDELTKFKEGDKVFSGPGGPEPGIRPVQIASMIGDYQIVEARILADFQRLSGNDALLQGQALGDRTTAGEVGTRARLFGMKLDSVVDNTETFVEELATQILQHLKKFRTVEDVIQVVGPEGVEWRSYTSEDIQADMDVEVETFSAPKEDPAVRRQQALQVLELATQAMPVLAQVGAGEQLNYPKVFARTLDAFGDKDIEQFFVPQTPQPAEPAGQGTPPAVAGALAPGQVPQQPTGGGNPAEGLTPEDLLMQLQGAGLTGGQPMG